jgi:hypothetical protein
VGGIGGKGIQGLVFRGEWEKTGWWGVDLGGNPIGVSPSAPRGHHLLGCIFPLIYAHQWIVNGGGTGGNDEVT